MCASVHVCVQGWGAHRETDAGDTEGGRNRRRDKEIEIEDEKEEEEGAACWGKNPGVGAREKKKIISSGKKKSCEGLCSAQAMEVMPGWGLCSFHHKAPSGILARPRLSKPFAL